MSSAALRARDRERDREQEDPAEDRPRRQTEVHIPVAAIRDALFVSSAVCADASNPVIVYCGISRPSPKTSRNAELANEVVPSPKPELLTVSVKT